MSLILGLLFGLGVFGGLHGPNISTEMQPKEATGGVVNDDDSTKGPVGG